MQAVMCNSYGPASSLTIEDIAAPSPGPGEILVDVAYVGLNFFDTLIIENKYQVKPPLPFSPASEFSGHIRALGAGVTGFAIGQPVAGFIGYGAARAQVCCPSHQIVALPEGLSLEKAAGLFVTYGTTLHALKQRGHLRKGETLAVLGASGGVGLAAVEIGHAMGARVIACASSPEKLAFARKAGADEGIDYHTSDLKDALKAATNGRGVDVIYDPVGGALTESALRAIAWAGRLLVIGFAAGEIPRIPLNLALLKGCDIVGVFWGDFVRREPALHQENMREIFNMVRDGAISAHIHKIFPLSGIAEALGVLTRREALGKVLLKL
ncbi:MAG: NADPH:quinone oxidoreductase family protein [Hyphomicrobiales bacterium]|nr:NADPH:quinone oxidoreductase family protein [Hyphomicrobiales bacterium]MDE2114101.1 NADPH:quinone oxidoreductase family protein [Hyphomicrobiales bacterium]